MENLKELASLQSQVKDLKLQDQLGKQKIHEDMKKVFEPVTKSLENTSEDLAKTMMLTSKENNKALEKFNNKPSEIMNDRDIMAP